MHKYHINTLPTSLHCLFTRSTLNVRTRSGSEISKPYLKSTHSQQAISYRATHLWNLLPNTINFLENSDQNSVTKTLHPLREFVMSS